MTVPLEKYAPPQFKHEGMQYRVLELKVQDTQNHKTLPTRCRLKKHEGDRVHVSQTTDSLEPGSSEELVSYFGFHDVL